jgi:RNA polymerase sigma-70 factor (ECF subfamily)
VPDELKSARHQRETYIGPWLPDPVVEEEEQDDVTLPLMLALERLSPLERAAFLLHDVFGLAFDEVAATIQREPAACRQLRRGRAPWRESRPLFRSRRSGAWHSQGHSSTPHAAETWARSARCWRPM